MGAEKIKGPNAVFAPPWIAFFFRRDIRHGYSLDLEVRIVT